MYYCSHITTDLSEEWEALVKKNSAGGFHQSFGWAEFKQRDGWDTYKIGLFSSHDHRLVGGAVIYQFTFKDGTNFLYIPEGPILDYENDNALFWQWRALEVAIHTVANLRKNESTTHIRIEPRVAALPEWFLSGWEKSPLNLQPKHTQIVDLTLSEEALLEQMKPKGRYNIKLAEKKGVVVEEASVSMVDSFYSLYKKTFQRDKFEGKDKELFKHLTQGMEEHCKIFFAKAEQKTIAAGLMVYFGGRATYLYGASDDELRNYMAPYLLHWRMMVDAKNSGYKEYDFWGIAPTVDEEHDWNGITIFKKKFGGFQLDLLGAYDYIIQPDLYDAFVKKHES